MAATKQLSAPEKATLAFQAQNYLDGLRIERVGYVQRIEIAKDDGDEAAQRKYEKRLAQVDAEIERIELGGEVTPSVKATEVYLGVDDDPAPKSKPAGGSAAKA